MPITDFENKAGDIVRAAAEEMRAVAVRVLSGSVQSLSVADFDEEDESTDNLAAIIAINDIVRQVLMKSFELKNLAFSLDMGMADEIIQTGGYAPPLSQPEPDPQPPFVPENPDSFKSETPTAPVSPEAEAPVVSEDVMIEQNPPPTEEELERTRLAEENARVVAEMEAQRAAEAAQPPVVIADIIEQAPSPEVSTSEVGNVLVVVTPDPVPEVDEAALLEAEAAAEEARLAAELAAEAEAARVAAEAAVEAEAERTRLAEAEAVRLAEEAAAAEQARIEAERIVAEEAARTEAARLELEAAEAGRQEAARVEAEAAEQALLAEEARLAAERLAAEEERDRLAELEAQAARDAEAEAARLAAEAQARLEAEQEADRQAALAAEIAREQERLAVEEAAAAERATIEAAAVVEVVPEPAPVVEVVNEEPAQVEVVAEAPVEEPQPQPVEAPDAGAVADGTSGVSGDVPVADAQPDPDASGREGPLLADVPQEAQAEVPVEAVPAPDGVEPVVTEADAPVSEIVQPVDVAPEGEVAVEAGPAPEPAPDVPVVEAALPEQPSMDASGAPESSALPEEEAVGTPTQP